MKLTRGCNLIQKSTSMHNMHTQWWKYRPLVHDRKAQLLPTKSRNAPTISKWFGQNVERIAKKREFRAKTTNRSELCQRSNCLFGYQKIMLTFAQADGVLDKIWVWQCVGESDRAETISTDRAPRQAARIPNMLLNCWSAVAAFLFYCSELPN